jgi:radical SAM superfamily enzyme YgiQ (UPF0313 family)
MADITIANLFYSAAAEKNGYIPIGPLYIVSVLEQEGYDVDFRDYQVGGGGPVDPMNPASVAVFLEDSADIIGIGCAGEFLPVVLLAVERLKGIDPRRVVMLGGIGPSGAAAEIVRHFPDVDCVVMGEGERSSLEVMERIAGDRGDIPKIVAPGIRIKSPDKLPFPAYHRVRAADYAHAGVYSARGCPYTCAFCDVAPFWGGVYEARSVSNLVDEIEILVRAFGRRSFDIMDDIFVLDRERAMAFCRELRRRDLDIQWACCGRIDLMDEDLMKVMADSGCSWVFYGIESGADHVLKAIEKGFTVAEVRRVVEMSRRYFGVVASLMWGYPREGAVDFDATVELIYFLRDLGCGVDLYRLVPLPMSPLYKKYAGGLVVAPDTCRRVFGERGEEMEAFVRRFPGVSNWYYRYPTPAYEYKTGVVDRLELSS